MDPIAELIAALESEGRPRLPWIVRWSTPSGGDPVAAAWAISCDVDAMTALLQRVDPSAVTRASAAAERALGPWWYTRASSEIAPVFRRAVPTPPTLELLLAASKPR